MAYEQIAATKQCSKCQEKKPLSAFGRSPLYADGYRGQCKICRTAASAAWRKAHPGYDKTAAFVATRRRKKLREKYQLTEAEWQYLLESQRGKCAICRSSKPGGRWNRFVVDHCHDTGRVRGLLCAECNTLLGRLGDNLAGVKRFFTYLKKRTSNGVSRQLSLPGI